MTTPYGTPVSPEIERALDSLTGLDGLPAGTGHPPAASDYPHMPIRLAQATPTGSGTVLLPPTSATERVSTGEFGWTHAPAPLLATR